MKALTMKALTLAICTGSAFMLSACGSDNNDNNSNNQQPGTQQPSTQTETIKGTAATGKALVGKVVVKNKDGKESSAVEVKADGTFEVAAPKGAPYLIKAYNDQAGDQAITLYSYAADAKAQVNVNQLTTQAMFAANNQANLVTLYAEWAKQNAALTQTKIEEAAKQVAANLQAQFTAAGIDAKTLNIFNYKFTPNGTGFDAVLDKVKISGFNNCNVSSCNINYTVNGVNYGWNYTIDTSGYNLTLTNGNGGGFGGNQNLKITTSVSTAGISTPDVVVNIPNIDKPTNQQEFCGDVSVTGQLPAGYKLNSCTFNGTTGNIAATVSANGFNVSYTVKYEYSPV